MRISRKKLVRYLDADGKRVARGTPGATRTIEATEVYWGWIGSRRVPLTADKTTSKQLLQKLRTDATLRRNGIGDRFQEHEKRPLCEHLADFRRELEARGNAPRYVALVYSRLSALLSGCGFTFAPDLSASRAMDWLADLRGKGRARVALPTDQEWFTLREVGRLLGVKPASVGAAVRRNRLEAEGQGKARRLPRATVEALQDRLTAGASVQTTNDYLSALKSFGRWMVKDRRSEENPFTHLEAGNARMDRRHDRRELEVDELRRLLAATLGSDRTFLGLDGRARFHLYLTAAATGFRASALAALVPEDFDLGNEPTVTLAARHAKNRKTAVQPLPLDVADALRAFLADKPAGRPVWPGRGPRTVEGRKCSAATSTPPASPTPSRGRTVRSMPTSIPCATVT